MSSPYTQQVLKVIVAQVCQTIGWNSIQTTPLELLGDILHKYLQEVSHQTHRYSELYGRSEPNLDDVALAFRDMNIVIPDLEEYVTNVDPVPCAIEVPKYPHLKENHLNFLKPGCKEVITRPVHVNEYLPPMYPEKEEEEKPIVSESDLPDVQNGEMTPTVKDENDVFSSPETSEASRIRTLSETEVRLTREITSVMMTTSGFISPAREGKLPDSKTPIIQTFDYPKPMPKEAPLIATVPPLAAFEKGEKLNKKKKPSDKKDKVSKDLFKTKVAPMGPPPPKQMPAMVEAIYPPSDSPMAAVVEQQQQQQQQQNLKRKSMSKSEKKQKHKDGNKTPTTSADGKLSKKKKKQNEKLPLMPMNKPKQWNPMAIPGIAPLNNISSSPSFVDTENYNKIERPLTPDIPNDMFLNDSRSQMSPLFSLPVGTTGTLTPVGPSPTPSPPTTPNQYEGKISSEPDKRKMNIFKRISTSKNKEDLVKTMLPHNLNLPETSIFPIDDTPDPYQSVVSPRKHQFAPPAMKHDDQPINMSIPKQLQVLPDPMVPFDLTSPGGSANNSPSFGSALQFIPAGPTGKPKKEPKPKKVREKKPPKVREKKNKSLAPDWPHNIVPDVMITNNVVPPLILTSPIRQAAPKKMGHLPPTLGNIDDDAMMNQFGPPSAFPMPWFNANSGLIPGPMGLGGPGLIPNAGLFPPFPMNAHHRPSFGHGPMVDMAPFGQPNPNRMPDFPLLKRARIEDEPFAGPPTLPIEVEKVKCNVAPLVPASLKLDDDLEIVPTTPNKPNKSKANLMSPNSSKHTTSPIKQKEPKPLFSDYRGDMPAAHPDVVHTAQKRRRSTVSPPKAPVIIDLDVQSISDDELPDDMDLEDIQPSAAPAPVHSDAVLPAMDKKDKAAAKLEKKKDKEQRKKDKEGKIKKKKDKKDKTKNKEKSEKRKEKEEKKRDKEAKDKVKKEKREKKREKERLAALAAAGGDVQHVAPMDASGSAGFEGAARLGFGGDLGHDSSVSNVDSEGSVPKLTLKLGQSPRPSSPDAHRKITIKPPKKDRLHDAKGDSDNGREPSPELVRFSALVTRPPKQKTPSTKKQDEDKSLLGSLSPISSSDNSFGSITAVPVGPSTSTASTPVPPSISPGTPTSNGAKHLNHNTPGPGRGRPPKGSTISAISTLPPGGASIVLSAADTLLGGVGPPMAIAGVMNGIHAQKQQRKMNPPKMGDPKSAKIKSSKMDRPGTGSASATGVQDSEGNQVWICPACGRVDDGTPMIGCDGCDAWYHWVCVGIQVPPDTNEDWYCRVCIAKKQEQAGSDKKKKRKKKDKKDH